MKNDYIGIEAFDYGLPERFIAQTPLAKRDDSKLLIYDRAADKHEIKRFYNICDYLRTGDVVVINETRVIPARLFGVRPRPFAAAPRAGGAKVTDTAAVPECCNGVKIELLLLKKETLDTYSALIKPMKRVRVGEKIFIGGTAEKPKLIAELIAKDEAEGIAAVRLSGGKDIEAVIDEIGVMPLPHYIKETLKDKERYQTIYNKVRGSAAAPTAGLHWTMDLMEEARKMGICFTPIILNVGLGTFRPVKTDNILQHKMHREDYKISKETAEIINKAKAEGRRIIACGTTSLRALEGCYKQNGAVVSGAGSTDIFIYPPYKFNVCDALITNFHLPKSTLIMLVSAFAARDKIMKLYEIAKQNDFRFFSFGDAMFIF